MANAYSQLKESLLQNSESLYGPSINGGHLINNQIVSGSQFFDSLNSSDREDVVGRFPSAQANEVAEAVKAANIAYQKWRKVPAPIRGSKIGQLSKILEREKEQLARIITREVGKPHRESLGEVQEAIDTAQFFQSEGRRLYGQTVPSELPNKELYTYRRPLGVCLMITASNFPFAVPSWKMIPALLAGNTIVWKASQEASATALSFAMCFLEAGFPEGTVNLLHGDGKTGELLLNHVEKKEIHKVSFTGSSKVGERIGEVCGKALQSPSLELGGKNPLIIHEDANLEKAIPTSIVSCFGTGGQRCTSTGSIIIHEKVYDQFKEKFVAAAKKVKIGNSMMSQDILYGPLFAERYLKNFLEHLEWGPKEGAKLILGSGQITSKNPYEHFVGDPDKGCYVTPHVWEAVTREMRLFQEEIFGPSINFVKSKSLEESIELANAHAYGLSSAIFTDNPYAMLQFKEDIQAGMSSINNSTTGAEAHLPFGGTKSSGNGTRESGIWVLESYTRWHAVNVDLAPHLQLAQMDVDYGQALEPISYQDWAKPIPQ